MSDAKLSRAYLETLPSADLIALADDFGIDIPENLNRRFIIGELLEVAEELADEKVDEVDSNPETEDVSLSETYNETLISAVLRNPVWLFVYWDLKKDHISLVRSEKVSSLSLRVVMFHRDAPGTVADSFDVPITLEDRNRYVLLPAGFGHVRVDLVVDFEDEGHEILSSTGIILLPYVSEKISNPLLETPVSPVLKLSGLPELLRTHYTNHRQSFF